MTKDRAKIEIQKLVNKFNSLTPFDLRNYNEANTRRNFILPLFRALGWDVYADVIKDEVNEEETSISGRIDYSFRIGSTTRFILEAKSIPENLDKEIWAKQAVEYGWNKGIAWVVLTDFEGLKVFNSEWDVPHPRPNLELKYNEYVDRFEDLWLLSKESMGIGELDKQAQKWGITAKRESVNKHLAEDLLEWRKTLTKYFTQWNPDEKTETIEESVQRILDRLIFIRVVEDKNIEEKNLWQTFQKWQSNDYVPQNFIEKLAPLFRDFELKYDSNLFEKHPCEELYTTQEPFKEIIPDLYADKEAGVKYRFDAINSDVLGNVYEQYLGYIQGREGDKSKRKKSGIYYTPSYIVDYIVKNSLKPVLDKCNSIEDLKKIKVLDPACGSGSFLIKVLDIIYEKYKEFGNKGGVFTKIAILLNNIYGVDLDSQAVEIAKLNLLINACDKRVKLPNLNTNIRNGNSLVSGSDGELKKYFGKNYRDRKPFNWQGEFPEVFKQGGFNVIVGNPPYVVLNANDEQLEYIKKVYKSSQGGKTNLYKAFIEKGISLLTKGGHLGFICPSNYLTSADSASLRKILIEETKLIEIIEYSEKDKIFEDVTQALTTIVLERDKNNREHKFHLTTIKHGDNWVFQKDLHKNKYFQIVAKNKIIDLMDSNKLRFSDLCQCYQGEINVSTQKNFFSSERKEGSLPLLRGSDVMRYQLLPIKEFCLVSVDRRNHWQRKRIVFQEVSNQQQIRRIKATLVQEGVLCGHTTNYCIANDSKTSLFLVLGLLNSKLFNYYFSYLNNTNHVPVGEVKKIPIPNNFIDKGEAVGSLVESIVILQNEIANKVEHSNEWRGLKSNIERIDRKIDEEVYKLYGLTQEEVKTIEAS